MRPRIFGCSPGTYGCSASTSGRINFVRRISVFGQTIRAARIRHAMNKVLQSSIPVEFCHEHVAFPAGAIDPELGIIVTTSFLSRRAEQRRNLLRRHADVQDVELFVTDSRTVPAPAREE